MRAVELTPTSWILYDDNEAQIGILVSRLSSYSLFTTSGPLHFAGKEDLFMSVGEITFKKRIVMENKDIVIEGLPVDDDNIFNIGTDGDFATYTKTEHSKVKFAAGYWGINFSGAHQWYIFSFCPKLDTLTNNDHVGPFDSRFIALQEISVANKRLNDDK